MKQATIEAWVNQVVTALEELMKKPDTPLGDLEWLHLRCIDTLGYFKYSEELQQASALELIKDLERFEEEFPGLLLPEVLTRASAVLEVLGKR